MRTQANRGRETAFECDDLVEWFVYTSRFRYLHAVAEQMFEELIGRDIREHKTGRWSGNGADTV
jgi:hypothetical protein